MDAAVLSVELLQRAPWMTPSQKQQKTNTPHKRTTYWKQGRYTRVRVNTCLTGPEFYG